jgi:hypothetical protein
MLPTTRHDPKQIAHMARELNTVLTVSLESALAARMTSTTWHVEPLLNVEQIQQNEFVLLTVSSFHFRLLVLLHFSAMSTALNYVADALKQTPESLKADGCYDYLAELGNQFCGEVKRIVGLQYPHIGMSTPMRLSNTSLPYVHNLKTCLATHVRAIHDEKDIFVGSIYLCTDDGFEFQVDSKLAKTNQVQTSALELF